MFNRVKKWIKIVGRLPMENQVLRSDVQRLTTTCRKLERQRNMWQEMHRAAGVGYMASQDMMMKEIIRLAEKAGEMPAPGLSKVVEMYAEAHVKPHVDPPAEPAKPLEQQIAEGVMRVEEANHPIQTPPATPTT